MKILSLTFLFFILSITPVMLFARLCGCNSPVVDGSYTEYTYNIVGDQDCCTGQLLIETYNAYVWKQQGNGNEIMTSFVINIEGDGRKKCCK